MARPARPSGSPGRSPSRVRYAVSAPSRSPASRASAAASRCAPTTGSIDSAPPPPSASASTSTWSRNARTCGSGSAPVKPGTSWPCQTTCTVGMLWTCAALDSRWLASTSMLASTQRPPSASREPLEDRRELRARLAPRRPEVEHDRNRHRAVDDLSLEGLLRDVDDDERRRRRHRRHHPSERAPRHAPGLAPLRLAGRPAPPGRRRRGRRSWAGSCPTFSPLGRRLIMRAALGVIPLCQ